MFLTWGVKTFVLRRLKHNNTPHNGLELRDQRLIARRRDDDVDGGPSRGSRGSTKLGDEPREPRLDAVAPALRDAN